MKPRDELPSLEELGQKIEAARPKENPSGESASTHLGTAMKFGIELVAGVAVGSVAGIFLDRWLETTPWLFLICFCLGTAGGVLNMIRTAKRDQRKLEQTPGDELKD